jgi:hypothetical protein
MTSIDYSGQMVAVISKPEGECNGTLLISIAMKNIVDALIAIPIAVKISGCF